MLNFRLLYILISPRSTRVYLGLTAGLGLVVLLDIILFLKLSLMVGPWITMAVLAANAAAGILIIYYLVDLRSRQLVETIDEGHFDSEIFSRYLSTLAASLFLIMPGLLNTLAGILLLIPFVGVKLGDRMARLTGIDWQEAYEFLRLDRLAEHRIGINAES